MSELSDLMTRWVHGWVAARSLPAPEDLGDGLRVLCHQPGRDVEIFARSDDAASIASLAARVGREPDPTWLTVPTTRPEKTASLLEDGGLTLLKRSESLMTAVLGEQPSHAVPEPYYLHIEHVDSMIYVEVRDRAGEAAARGAAGICGTDAIMDRILTWPDHRRRGLANAVMSTLAAAALERGARSGILVASEEGQLLYRTLGWSDVSRVVIAAVNAE
jgi:GNAT superfamily N-acetyltransferase